MLQIIFFTILFAVCMLMVGEPGRKVAEGAERLNQIMMQVVTVVMHVAPYGVFSLMARDFCAAGPGSDHADDCLFWNVVVVALLLHASGTLMTLLRLLAGISPIMFLRKSAHTPDICLQYSELKRHDPGDPAYAAEKRLGVDNPTASFIVPFGATINMDGTAIMQGVATIFVANVYGIDLGLSGYLTVIGMAVLASIGTAGVPGVGLIMLAMVFTQVGLPVEGIALIMGVDRLLDMMRTAVNVTGDCGDHEHRRQERGQPRRGGFSTIRTPESSRTYICRTSRRIPRLPRRSHKLIHAGSAAPRHADDYRRRN